MGLNLCISLACWIIQDGNYRDFTRGDRAAFAIEFHAPTGLIVVPSAFPSVSAFTGIGENNYLITGQVTYVAEDWWVVDVGVPIFCEEKPPPVARPDAWVSGKVELGIDPFFYFERLAKLPGAPALIHDWRIDKIEIQTAPWVETPNMPLPPENPNAGEFKRDPAHSGRRVYEVTNNVRTFARDAARYGWREIERTDAWQDDEGSAEYLIHCTRLDGSPRRTIASE